MTKAYGQTIKYFVLLNYIAIHDYLNNCPALPNVIVE
jgi:hypothetical protein